MVDRCLSLFGARALSACMAIAAVTVRAQAPAPSAEIPAQHGADAGPPTQPEEVPAQHGADAGPPTQPEEVPAQAQQAPVQAQETPAQAPEASAPLQPEEQISEPLYAASAISGRDPRSLANDWMIAPADTLRLGFENILVTADGDLSPLLGTPQLRLTDLVLLRAAVGYSVEGKVELFASASLLPKQPIASDAPVFQGAGAGARIGLTSGWALTVGASGGPTIGRSGSWVEGAVTLDGRYRADRYLVFEGELGTGATGVYRSHALVGLSEALASGEVIFQEPHTAAITAGVGFAFPFWSHDAGAAPLDPQTRVDIHATGVIAVADDWDVWLSAAVIDRGDLSVPASVLPILDGGFDQQQLTLGVAYRSEGREPEFGL